VLDGVTAFVDEDDMSSDSATSIPSQQSVKAYVDSVATASDLDFQADSGGALSIDLDSETMTFTGGTGVDTSGSGNAVTFAIDATVATLAGSQALTNKTLTSPVLNTGVSGTAVLDEDDMSSDSATQLATQQSIKAYVDSQVASADTLAELTDTNVTSPADGALLFYDTGTSKWIDNVVSGDITIADTGVAAIGSGVIVNDDVNASAAISVSKTALAAGTGLTLSTNTLSVDASQTQITAVGTIGTGTWQGSVISDTYVANDLTISGGTIENTVIGAATAAAGTFTTFTSTGIDDNAVSTAITIDSSQDVTFTSDAKFPDNGKAIFGAGSDLEIYHNATDSVIADVGTGNLKILANDLRINNADSSKSYITGVNGSYVNLYYNGAQKLVTTNTGIDVTGDVNSDSVTTGTFTSTGIDDNATSTAITIDSSENVGIGTASPNAYTNYTTLTLNGATSSALDFEGGGTLMAEVLATANDLILQTAQSDGELIFKSAGGSEAVRIDSSGNVGIGTASPNTYGLGIGRIVTSYASSGTQYALFSAVGSGTGGGEIDFGNHTVRHASVASLNGSVLAFYTNGANSGSGVSERMRIDNSGNVGIGTSSPSSYGYFAVDRGAPASADRTIASFMAQSTRRMGLVWDDSQSTLGLANLTSHDLCFHIGGIGGANEKMRIDTSGNVGIGTSSPSEKLEVSGSGATRAKVTSTGSSVQFIGSAASGGMYIDSVGAADNIIFRNTGSFTERMRIDSSGNVLVGTDTSGSSRLVASKSVATGVYTTKLIDTNTTAGNCFGLNIDYSAAAPNGSGNQFIYCEDSSALRMSVTSNGGISNYQAFDSNLSDQRAKKDIVESGNYLEKLCSIPVRNFRYKEDAQDGKHHLGVISQEVEAVCPELIQKSSWDYNGEKMDAVYNTDLLFAMMKAIQELKAEVAALKGE
jgi:hypothetical protein